MKKVLTPSRTLATTLLLGLGSLAAAQSLGSLQGKAWIGQPLDVAVPASEAIAETGECVHADVLYGDTRVGAGKVRASIVGSGNARRLRIESDAAIDEPVVTVAVRAGCRNTVMRSYTVLADLPDEQMLAAAAAPMRSAPAAGVISTALAAQPAAPALLKVRPPRPAKVLAEAAPPAPAPRSVVHVARTRAAAAPRLVVQPWQPEAQALLRVSATLSDPATDAARRATAALLWQAINGGPEQLLRTSAEIERLQGELAQLRQAATQNRTDIVALRRELQSPQASLLADGGAKWLALLVLLAGAGAAWVQWRNTRVPRTRGEWTGAPVEAMFEAPASDAVQEVVAPSRPQAVPTPQPAAGEPPAAAPVPPRVVAIPVRTPTAIMLRVETLAATFDEVAFLCSLGLWNDAMDVLKTYVEDSTAPAPLAYYELMRLCVQTDDGASLVAVRKRYSQVFSVDAPKFEQIDAPKGLEAYPDLAKRITGAWGTPDALDFIELTLFTATPPGKAFSLQAGRELLFLHDLAMALLREGGPAEDNDHALAPWADAENMEQAQRAAQDAADFQGGNRFALDLDLAAAAEELPDSQPMPLEPVRKPAPRAPAPAPAMPEFSVSGPGVLLDDEDAFSAAVSLEKVRPTRF